MATQEKAVENLILKYLNLKGCFAFKVNTTGIFDPIRQVYRRITNPYIHKGTADIIGLYRGQFFAIEVKTPETKNRVTENQSLFLDRVKEKGGISTVLYDLNGAVEFFDSMKTAIEMVDKMMR